eukprot:4018051-Pyramimonas_sp.AAC.2
MGRSRSFLDILGHSWSFILTWSRSGAIHPGTPLRLASAATLSTVGPCRRFIKVALLADRRADWNFGSLMVAAQSAYTGGSDRAMSSGFEHWCENDQERLN